MIQRFALLLLFVFLAACSGEKKAAEKKAAQTPVAEPPVVKTVTAESRSVERSILVTGSLQPDETVSISSEVAGRIAKVNADFGQTVRKGTVLAEIEPTEFSIDIERKRAAISQTLARLGLDPQNFNAVPDSTPAIRQATAQLEDAKSKFDSAAKLVKSGDIARERYTELEKGLRAREEAVAAARDEMRTQWAGIASLKADLRMAEKHKSDTQVRAPFDGTVAARMASPGQYMKENTPIMTLVKNYPLRLRLEVPESDAATFKAGTPLRFTTDAMPGETFTAIVQQLNPMLDSKSRTLSAEARPTKADSRLRPGMFVQVRLTTAAASKVVAVPKQAVYSVAGLTKLFVIANGKASEKRFIPGQEIGDWIEVPNGIVAEGDKIAINQLGILVDKLPVRQ